MNSVILSLAALLSWPPADVAKKGATPLDSLQGIWELKSLEEWKPPAFEIASEKQVARIRWFWWIRADRCWDVGAGLGPTSFAHRVQATNDRFTLQPIGANPRPPSHFLFRRSDNELSLSWVQTLTPRKFPDSIDAKEPDGARGVFVRRPVPAWDERDGFEPLAFDGVWQSDLMVWDGVPKRPEEEAFAVRQQHGKVAFIDRGRYWLFTEKDGALVVDPGKIVSRPKEGKDAFDLVSDSGNVDKVRMRIEDKALVFCTQTGKNQPRPAEIGSAAGDGRWMERLRRVE